jgi:hypothetical protein
METTTGQGALTVLDTRPSQTLTPNSMAGEHADDATNLAGSGAVDNYTWTDVFNLMQNASSEYREKSESSKVRAAQRDKAIAVTLLSLTDMIPEQDGLSILRGGMSTIFKVTPSYGEESIGDDIQLAGQSLTQAKVARQAHRERGAHLGSIRGHPVHIFRGVHRLASTSE